LAADHAHPERQQDGARGSKRRVWDSGLPGRSHLSDDVSGEVFGRDRRARLLRHVQAQHGPAELHAVGGDCEFVAQGSAQQVDTGLWSDGKPIRRMEYFPDPATIQAPCKTATAKF
jgi:hypothetical protein